MALGVTGIECAESIVSIGGVNGDLMVKSAAADIVDLVDNIPSGVIGALARGSIRGDSVQNVVLHGVPLDEVRCVVPGAAKAESLFGAMLYKVLARLLDIQCDDIIYLAGGAIASVQEAAEAVVASAVSLAWRSSKGCGANGTLVRVLHLDGTSSVDKRSLLNSISGLSFSTGQDLVPVCLGCCGVALGGIILGNDTHKSGSDEEEVLEGNHFDLEKKLRFSKMILSAVGRCQVNLLDDAKQPPDFVMGTWSILYSTSTRGLSQ